MNMFRGMLLVAMAGVTTSPALAAIGDFFVRVRYCHGVDGGEYVIYGSGTCSAAETVFAMFGHTIKECTQLQVVPGQTNGGNYSDIVDNPQLPSSGELLNVGSVGQGISIVWRPDGLPHAVRRGASGIELAPLPLAFAPKGTDLESFVLVRAGEPALWVTGAPLGNVQGDFEIAYESTQASAVPQRQAFSISNLQFAPTVLPCSIADLEGDGDIDVFDLITFLQNFIPTANCPFDSQCGLANLDGDTDIDVFDLITFLQSFDPNNPDCE